MKASLSVAVVAAFLSTSVLANPPACANDCWNNNLASTGCSWGDGNCLCKNTGALNSAASCISSSSCSQDDKNLIQKVIAQNCVNVGVSLTNPAFASWSLTSSGSYPTGEGWGGPGGWGGGYGGPGGWGGPGGPGSPGMSGSSSWSSGWSSAWTTSTFTTTSNGVVITSPVTYGGPARTTSTFVTTSGGSVFTTTSIGGQFGGPGGPGGFGGGPFGGGMPWGPFASTGAWTTGPWTNWFGKGGNCPDVSWTGWTSGQWSTNAPWTSWSGCSARPTSTSTYTTTSNGQTLTKTTYGYQVQAASATLSQTTAQTGKSAASGKLTMGLGAVIAAGVGLLAVAL